MTLRKILILGLLFAAAVVYLIYAEIPHSEQLAEAGKIFRALNRRSIETIDVQNSQGGFSLKNEKPSSDSSEKDTPLDVPDLKSWSFTDVAGAELEQGIFNSLLGALVEFDFGEPIPATDLDPDLSIYGLKDPAAKISFKAGQLQEAVEFGKKNEYVGKRYARLSTNSQVSLVSEALFSAIARSKSELRNKNLIQFLDSDLSEIYLQSKSGDSIKVVPAQEGHWKLSEPVSGKASDTAISNLTRELRAAAVSEFLDKADPAAATYGLNDPDANITLTFKAEKKREPLVIAVGKISKNQKKEQEEVGAYFSLKGRSGVLKTSQDLVATISKSASDLREKQFLKFPIDQVSLVDIQSEGVDLLKLEWANNDWKVGNKPGEQVFIRDYLKTISDLAADSFPSQDADYGFGTPKLRIKLTLGRSTSQKDPAERLLVVGKETQLSGKKSYFAAVDDLAEPFIISEDSLTKIRPKEEVLARSPQAAEPGNISSVAPTPAP